MDEEYLKISDIKFDSLTEIYDRNTVVGYAKYLMEQKCAFSLALIDIDNFKNINDNYGHSSGDNVIIFLANKIKEVYGSRGVVGRFGGDEFVIVIKDIVEYDALWSLCREVTQVIDGIVLPNLPTVYLTCTLGVSRFPNDAITYDELFEKTDKALYRGKIKGRNCFIIYLDAKHKNINLHSSNDTTISSMQMHTLVFKVLNSAETFSEGIKNLFAFLSSNLMIDHIAIQTDKKLLFSHVHSLSRIKEFRFIKSKFIREQVSPSMGLYYLNDIHQLESIKQLETLDLCKEQGIKSLLYAEISFNEKLYGYVRADSTSTARIWQYKDMDLLITAANAIAMALHYQNKQIEDL